MTGLELLLLILLIVSVGLAVAAAATRDVRWLAAGFGAFALVFLCQLVNSL